MVSELKTSPQDYELQLVSFKAQVEPVASPAKKPKVQSASDSIIQEVRGHLGVLRPLSLAVPSPGAGGCNLWLEGWAWWSWQCCGAKQWAVGVVGTLLTLPGALCAVRGAADAVQ